MSLSGFQNAWSHHIILCTEYFSVKGRVGIILILQMKNS